MLRGKSGSNAGSVLDRGAKPASQDQETDVSELIAHASDETFDNDVLKSSAPVLVDFWATWCAPCKAIAPALDDLASTYEGRLKIVKVDIDKSQKIPRQYSVRGVPTLMLFRDGKVQATHIGMASKSQISQLIDKGIA